MQFSTDEIMKAVSGDQEAIESIIDCFDSHIDAMILQARLRSGGWLPSCDDVELKSVVQDSLRTAIPQFQVRV